MKLKCGTIVVNFESPSTFLMFAKQHNLIHCINIFFLLILRQPPQIAKFMGPTWCPPGSCRPQMGPMLSPWTLLSGIIGSEDIAPAGILTIRKGSHFWALQSIGGIVHQFIQQISTTMFKLLNEVVSGRCMFSTWARIVFLVSVFNH